MSFWNDRKVKAVRKKHQCNWCGEPICIGDPAVYFSGVYEGDFQCGYFHPECDGACSEYCRSWDDPDEGYPPCEGERGKPELKEIYR